MPFHHKKYKWKTTSVSWRGSQPAPTHDPTTEFCQGQHMTSHSLFYWGHLSLSKLGKNEMKQILELNCEHPWPKLLVNTYDKVHWVEKGTVYFRCLAFLMGGRPSSWWDAHHTSNIKSNPVDSCKAIQTTRI